MPPSAIDWLPDFSHIYVERAALDYDLTRHVRDRFSQAIVIEVDSYKDVFARARQSFSAQKQSQKLVLAVQQEPFIYKGSEVSHDFGNAHFHYTSSALNCIYNCEYCFLQGMFPSANLVIFVNIEDSFRALQRLLLQHPVYLSITYETDILALEPIVPLTSKWLQFARDFQQQGLTLEIRTKSANVRTIEHLQPIDNAILAWTLSPDEVIRRHEAQTPGLKARLTAISRAIDFGWRLRICFDPVLPIENWRDVYRACIEQTFSTVDAAKISDFSMGTFRISKEYLKRMRRDRQDSALLHYPFVTVDGVSTYDERLRTELLSFIHSELAKWVHPDLIYE